MSLNPKKLLNINNFLSEVRKNGFTRDNRTVVAILPPAELRDIFKFKLPSLFRNDFLTFYAQSAAFPGVKLGTLATNYGGPLIEYARSTDYDNTQIMFMLDDEMRQKTFFDAWMNLVNPKENKFDFRYRDEYIGEMLISQVSETGKYYSYAVKLFEVFPVAMNEIRSDWINAGDASRLEVNFSYRYWKNLRSDKFERDDADADEILERIDVIGERKPVEVLEGIDVIGRRNESEILESIDVIGRRNQSEILEGINVIGRRKKRT